MNKGKRVPHGSRGPGSILSVSICVKFPVVHVADGPYFCVMYLAIHHVLFFIMLCTCPVTCLLPDCVRLFCVSSTLFVYIRCCIIIHCEVLSSIIFLVI